MKPWNKIKWQAKNYQDPFDAWMQEPCEICGIRRWDCKGHKPNNLAAQTNGEAQDEFTDCWCWDEEYLLNNRRDEILAIFREEPVTKEQAEMLIEELAEIEIKLQAE